MSMGSSSEIEFADDKVTAMEAHVTYGATGDEHGLDSDLDFDDQSPQLVGVVRMTVLRGIVIHWRHQ